MKTIQLFANGEQFDYTPENGKIEHPCGFATSWTRPDGISVAIHDSADGLTAEMVDAVKRYTARALALADAMASALNALGEPFPLVLDCVKAGQHPQELVESMRPLLADILPAEYLEGYQECALWSSTDDDGEPLDDSGMLLAPETLDWFLADCGAFLGEIDGLDLPWRDEVEWNQLGRDLWLTRNGHGAGFWDRGLGDLGGALSEAAERQGSADLYIGDDGLIYQ